MMTLLLFFSSDSNKLIVGKAIKLQISKQEGKQHSAAPLPLTPYFPMSCHSEGFQGTCPYQWQGTLVMESFKYIIKPSSTCITLHFLFFSGILSSTRFQFNSGQVTVLLVTFANVHTPFHGDARYSKGLTVLLPNSYTFPCALPACLGSCAALGQKNQ